MNAFTLLLVPALLATPANSPAPVEKKDSSAEFARRLLNAVKAIQDGHFKAPPQEETLRWGVRGLFDAVKRPVPAQIEERLRNLAELDRDKRRQLLRDAHIQVRAKDLEDSEKALAVCLNAIMRELEPAAEPERRSAYVPAAEVPGCVYCRGDYFGIGLLLERDSATDRLRVKTPVWKGPAYLSGLRAGDVILDIIVEHDAGGHFAPRRFSTKGMSVARASELLLGPEGTRVTLRVVPTRPPNS